MQAVVGRDERRQQARDGGRAEERQLHDAAAIHEATEGVRLALRYRRVGEEWNRRCQMGGVKRAVAEEVEVHGLPVAEMQGDGGSAVEHELRWHGGEFVP